MSPPKGSVTTMGVSAVVWWWIGNLLFLFVIIPVVILLLNRVLRPTAEIHTYAVDVLDHGVRLTGTLDSVPKLAETRELTSAARGLAGRYVSALERLL
jgi:hypothetical protein